MEAQDVDINSLVEDARRALRRLDEAKEIHRVASDRFDEAERAVEASRQKFHEVMSAIRLAIVGDDM